MNKAGNTILIIDDTEANLSLLASLLEKEGYEVLAGESGAEALEIVQETIPDLMLLDVAMPGMDGFALCRKMKEDPRLKSIPVIFITARTDESDIVAGFEAGGNDYITKPFTIPELQVRVRTQLDLRRAQEELRQSAEKFQDLAIHDDLTGLYNTRYLYQALSLEVEASKATQIPLSLIFMDIDNFKRVVDTHGHLDGSEAIAEIAATIRSLILEPSFGVSYGGDEYVVVLPGFNKTQAMEKAEEIRVAIASTHYLGDRGLDVRLTVSCGVATFPDDGDDLTTILGLADQSLFAVKSKGKNGVGDGSEQRGKGEKPSD